MKTLAFLCLITVWGYAQSLDSLISQALATHPSLQTITSTTEALNKQQALDGKLSNPKLTVGMNDIRLDAPGRYQLEPMQSQYVMISQTFPINGELALKTQKTALEISSTNETLSTAKANLVANVKKLAYQVVANQQMNELQQQFGEILEQMGELHVAYGETGTEHHLMLIRSDISRSENELRLTHLHNENKRLLARLEELVGNPVESIEVSLEMKDLESKKSYLRRTLQLYPDLNKLHTKKKQTETSLKLAEVQSIPDITVGLGYFYRDAYEDYVSLSLAIPLPVYGREKAEEEREQYRLKSAQSTILEVERELKSQVAIAWQNAYESQQQQGLLKKILEQTSQAMKVINGQIESGQTRPEQLLRTANDQLIIEQKIIQEKLKFHLALTELDRLQGVQR